MTAPHLVPSGRSLVLTTDFAVASRRFKYSIFLALVTCALLLPTAIASGPGQQGGPDTPGKSAPFAVYPGFERFDASTKSTVAIPSARYGLSIHARRDAHFLEPLEPSATAQTAPNQVGVGRRLDLNSTELGKRFANPDGSKVRALSFVSPGALALRVHLEDFDLADGDQVYVYGLAEDSHVAGPYSGRGPFGTGEFWTDAVEGDTVVIEHYVRRHETGFRISELSHIYGSIAPDLVTPQVQSCEVDANCAAEMEMSAVGRMLFNSGGGSFVCTGTMLNNNSGDFSPLFLTAAHCISTQAEANTLTVYWFYRTTGCNSNVVAPGTPVSAGATLLSTLHTADETLLQITGALPAGLGFSGWNAAVVPGQTSAYGLHHPGGGLPPSLTSYLRKSVGIVSGVPEDCQPAGLVGGMLVNWSSGLTEPGSSGSGLFLGNHGGLVGTLSCGPDVVSCNNALSLYGRLSDFYPVIHTYLESGLGGANCVSTLAANVQSFGAGGGSGTVSVSGPSNCAWQAGSSAGWIVLGTGSSGTGNKQFGFSVLQNVGPARDGTITVQNQTVAIHQDAFACTYALNPSPASFGTVGGSGTVGVTAPSLCAWSPTSDVDWITITSGPGAGNGTISFSVAVNGTGSARGGHIIAGDQLVTITQEVGPAINAAVIQGKQLIVTGVNFVDGGSLLIDGAKQKKTFNDPGTPTTMMVARKAGKTISSGQIVQLQVRNPDGKTSPQFPFRRP